MGKGKWMGIYIAVLVALLAGPSLSSAAGPERINESFVMGDTGCQMNIELEEGTGGIVSAELGPAFEPPLPPPLPEEYAVSFTGIVYGVSGTVPFGVAVNNTISGTISYAPSTFALGSTTADSQMYLPAGDGSTIANLSVTFYNSDTTPIQSFQTSTFNYSTVINDRPDGVSPFTTLDMYDFQSEMSSSPTIPDFVTSVFFLRNNGGTAINNVAYPTAFTSESWPSPPSYLNIMSPGVYFPWTIQSSILNLVTIGPPPLLASPTVQQTTASAWCAGPLTPENISDTLVCKDCTGPDGDGIYTCTKENCEPKTAVERNVMEKSGDGSTYCYYDKLGRRVCKTI